MFLKTVAISNTARYGYIYMYIIYTNICLNDILFVVIAASSVNPAVWRQDLCM